MPPLELQNLVITGASGFLGRHLIPTLRDRYRIIGLARRSQGAVGVEPHPNVSWLQVDIADRERIGEAFRALREVPGPKVVLHLAAHYDFTGELHPEYERTNICGLRHVLEECRALRPERFLFASSVAACDFPPPGRPLDETSPPDGDHIYARTKRYGERVLARYADAFPSAIVRLGALFSDWCEYPPLYFFLGTWLSAAWNRRMLGGAGQSAIPHLHVRSAVAFFERLLEMHRELAGGEILIASTDGSISHLEVFEATTLAFYGHRVEPILVPRALARLGLWAMDLGGRMTGRRPFERPWMGRYIDRRLDVDASRTRARLGWAPNPRLQLLRRMPFLLENLKGNPVEWQRRNLEALKAVQLTPNLRLLHLFAHHEEEMVEASMARLHDPATASLLPHYRMLAEEEIRWAKRQLFLQLGNTIRTRDVGLFKEYCRRLAERRWQQGFPLEEVLRIISGERDLCLRTLRIDPAGAELEAALHDHVTMTFLVGLDEIEETYERLSGRLPGGGA